MVEFLPGDSGDVPVSGVRPQRHWWRWGAYLVLAALLAFALTRVTGHHSSAGKSNSTGTGPASSAPLSVGLDIRASADAALIQGNSSGEAIMPGLATYEIDMQNDTASPLELSGPVSVTLGPAPGVQLGFAELAAPRDILDSAKPPALSQVPAHAIVDLLIQFRVDCSVATDSIYIGSATVSIPLIHYPAPATYGLTDLVGAAGLAQGVCPR